VILHSWDAAYKVVLTKENIEYYLRTKVLLYLHQMHKMVLVWKAFQKLRASL